MQRWARGNVPVLWIARAPTSSIAREGIVGFHADGVAISYLSLARLIALASRSGWRLRPCPEIGECEPIACA
eukprot:3518374-Amphidinium_carterae.1